jgi:hypothetical protein
MSATTMMAETAIMDPIVTRPTGVSVCMMKTSGLGSVSMRARDRATVDEFRPDVPVVQGWLITSSTRLSNFSYFWSHKRREQVRERQVDWIDG